jgi:hypothetical protein
LIFYLKELAFFQKRTAKIRGETLTAKNFYSPFCFYNSFKKSHLRLKNWHLFSKADANIGGGFLTKKRFKEKVLLFTFL